jgi:hypothetical protein
VRAEGKGLVGHAGAALLLRCADRTGLTGALGAVFSTGHSPGWWDRGVVLVELAVSIVLGAVCMSDMDYGDDDRLRRRVRADDGCDHAGDQ